ncbi:hypothetical protein MXAN_2781 [Myxococcus xanthus DK 1622]|uniref:Uncharacterized protein n=1 Tax=Myxococcus xanthus (strain DK1622) TaxID=246197 RepID=Q1D8M5_MYXXD|nr:hypothetical protein MXAN_2781 [Myxococcus xanthus DK 1622]
MRRRRWRWMRWAASAGCRWWPSRTRWAPRTYAPTALVGRCAPCTASRRPGSWRWTTSARAGSGPGSSPTARWWRAWSHGPRGCSTSSRTCIPPCAAWCVASARAPPSRGCTGPSPPRATRWWACNPRPAGRCPAGGAGRSRAWAPRTSSIRTARMCPWRRRMRRRWTRSPRCWPGRARSGGQRRCSSSPTTRGPHSNDGGLRHGASAAAALATALTARGATHGPVLAAQRLVLGALAFVEDGVHLLVGLLALRAQRLAHVSHGLRAGADLLHERLALGGLRLQPARQRLLLGVVQPSVGDELAHALLLLRLLLNLRLLPLLLPLGALLIAHLVLDVAHRVLEVVAAALGVQRFAGDHAAHLGAQLLHLRRERRGRRRGHHLPIRRQRGAPLHLHQPPGQADGRVLQGFDPALQVDDVRGDAGGLLGRRGRGRSLHRLTWTPEGHHERRGGKEEGGDAGELVHVYSDGSWNSLFHIRCCPALSAGQQGRKVAPRRARSGRPDARPPRKGPSQMKQA